MYTISVVVYMVCAGISFILYNYLDVVSGVAGACGMFTCVIFPLLFYYQLHRAQIHGSKCSLIVFSLIVATGVFITVLVVPASFGYSG